MLFKSFDSSTHRLNYYMLNNQLIMMYKMINHLAPPYLSLLVSRPGQQQYTLRTNQNIPLIFGTNNSYVNSFLPNAVKEWNKLPIAIRVQP